MPRLAIHAAVAAGLFCVASSASAQAPFNLAVPLGNLASALLTLYGPNGLIVESLTVLPNGDTHSAHFNSDTRPFSKKFGTALTSKLVSVPLPSLASGFTFEFDPTLGVFTRTTESFGPILGERAETIGADRTAVGVTYQRFTFDTIEGLDLRQIPAVFTHDGFARRGGRDDIVTSLNAIDATVGQFTAFATYGATDRFDVSVAVPFVTTELTVVSDVRIRRLGTTDPQVHFFRSVDGALGDRRVFTAFGRASGVGDVTIRLKGTLARRGPLGLAVGMDLRLPTGDEQNLLGAGAPGVKGFFVWSRASRAFSPHVNAGYLWNGSSLLAGNPATGESKDLADLVAYTAGADFGLNRRFTFALDLLGQVAIGAPRLVRREFEHLNGVDVFPDITFADSTFNELSMAIGVKLGLTDEVLVDFNLLFRLDDNGLRDKVTPLVGLEYAR